MRSRFTGWLVVLLIANWCGASAADDWRRTEPSSGIELRASALLDLHMLVRKHASQSAAATRAGRATSGSELADLGEAPAAAQKLEQALGDRLLWGLIEPLIAAAEEAEQLEAALKRLPEAQTLRDGREVQLREPALAYAQALAKLEPAFRQRIWPAHQEAMRQGEARLREALGGREAQCVAHLLDSLGMQDPDIRVPVYLVAEAPAPEAFTHRGRNGAICIVGVSESDSGLLAEMLLHEFIHALDLATQHTGSALVSLRSALRQSDIATTDAAFRDIPHTLMFVQAGETVRRVLDPEHEHYGEARGYYAKVPEATAAVREPWQAFLDRKISAAEAIERIAQAVADRGE